MPTDSERIDELERRVDALLMACRGMLETIKTLAGIQSSGGPSIAELKAYLEGTPCANPWHDAPLEARQGTCVDCGARLAVGAPGELVDQAASVGCPTCGARAGERCTDSQGRSAGLMAHRGRVQVWRASRARP